MKTAEKHIDYSTAFSYCFHIFTAVSVIFLLSQCGASKKELANTDRRTVIQSITNQVILPSFNDFKVQTDSLLSATKSFTEAPSPSQLETLRQSWRSTAFAWKRASAYTFGPIEDNFLAGSIDYPSVHYANIEKSIQTTSVIDNAYINSKGTSLKGLKAIEYLLYQSGDSTAVVNEFRSSAQRRAYLNALAENLQIQAVKILESWEIYANDFINADGSDIKSSVSVLVNKMVSQVNMIRDERVAMPMGMRNQGEKMPESVEGRLSKTSVALLKNEITSVKACFGNENVQGIYTLLDQLEATYEGQPLSKVIAEQFTETERVADQITIPLDAAIINDPGKVNDLYAALKKLQILLEVDVVNQLGIILTFSDNDGD